MRALVTGGARFMGHREGDILDSQADISVARKPPGCRVAVSFSAGIVRTAVCFEESRGLRAHGIGA